MFPPREYPGLPEDVFTKEKREISAVHFPDVGVTSGARVISGVTSGARLTVGASGARLTVGSSGARLTVGSSGARLRVGSGIVGVGDDVGVAVPCT